MIRSLLLFSLLLLSACSATSRDLPTQEEVDLQRYVGTWYEQARLPNRFQKQCVADVQANYRLTSSTSLAVRNQCMNAEGLIESAEAEGRLSSAVQPPNPAILEVRFAPKWLSWIPMVWGDYWIIKIQGDYQYALVGTPNRELLWVLSRDPQADTEEIEALLDYAQTIGFDVSKVLKSENDNGTNEPVAKQ